MDIQISPEPLFVPKERIDLILAHIYPQTMQVSLNYAQEHLTDLAIVASNEEEVEIALPGKPALFLAPRLSEPASAPPQRPSAELLYAGCPIHGVPFHGWAFARRREPFSSPNRHIDLRFPHIYPQTMQVRLKYAQEHLTDLAIAASNCEEVEIALSGKPALFLAPCTSEPISTPPKRPSAELLYAWEGKITLPTDAEWRAMDKELEDEMLNGPIFPLEHA